MVLICLPTGEVKFHVTSGVGVTFPFQAGRPQKDRNIKVLFFWLSMSFFKREVVSIPQSLLQTILKTLESLAIGMSHL